MTADAIDQHVDHQRRVRRLETEVRGTPASYAQRLAHPHPIAEQLCYPSTVPAPRPFGHVAGQLWERELAERRLEIHRLLRIARERVGANDWIGNSGRFQLAATHTRQIIQVGSSIMYPYSHGYAPREASQLAFFSRGQFADRLVVPGRFQYRYQKLSATGPFLTIHQGWVDGGEGNGVADISGIQTPRMSPWPEGTSLDGVPVEQDSFVVANTGFVALPFDYGRATNVQTFYTTNPPSEGGYEITAQVIAPSSAVLLASPDGQGDWGPQGDQRSFDEHSVAVMTPPLYHAGEGEFVHPDFHEEVANIIRDEPETRITRKYIVVPTDWIRCWGPVAAAVEADTWPSTGGAAFNHTKPFTQATFDAVAAVYEDVLAHPDLTQLLTWYEDTEIIDTPYDHVWVDVESTGQLGATLRHGVVVLRGWLQGSGGGTDFHATLPAGYRPIKSLYLNVPSTDGPRFIRIDPTGGILVTDSASLRYFLDSVTYPPAPA